VATVALLHSPLTSAATWGELPVVLRRAGHDVVVPEVSDDDEPSFAARYVARSALALRSMLGATSAVLVAHSGAGPLLAQVGFARQASGAAVDGYVFLDAGLPRTLATRNRLDLMAVEDAESAAALRAHLESGGRFPPWTEADLAEEVPDATQRAALVAGLRPRSLDFFTEELPLAEDWPDAPTGYLRLSAAYDQPARTAHLRGWPVVSRDLGHFGALTHPTATALALTELLDAMLGD
jgi:hypothetical protein